MKQLKFTRFHPLAIKPELQTTGAGGYDLHTVERATVFPNEVVTIGTGVGFQIEPGYVGFIRARSSTSAKRGLNVVAGIVDSDYRGEVRLIVHNMTDNVVEVDSGTRLAHILFMPVATPELEEVYELSATERGEGGFGSTG